MRNFHNEADAQFIFHKKLLLLAVDFPEISNLRNQYYRELRILAKDFKKVTPDAILRPQFVNCCINLQNKYLQSARQHLRSVRAVAN